MVWQDIVIAILTILFGYALIPQIYYGFKHKKATVTFQTSLITGIGLYIMGLTFFTLQLYFTTIMDIITGTLWMILFIQKLVYK